MGDKIKIGCWIFVLVVIPLTITLVVTSLKRVEHDEYALEFNGYDPTLKPKVWEEGRIVMKPDSHLVKFNRKIVPIDFTGPDVVRCWTSDGLQMELTLKVQYQIIKDELFDLVNDEFRREKRFKKYLVSFIAGSFMDSCSNFTAEEYFTKRKHIDLFMHERLSVDVVNAKAHIEVVFVQLENAQHPQLFVTAVENKQVAQQDVEKAKNERDEILINAETRELEAEQEALILINQAKADSTATIFAAEENAAAKYQFWVERTLAYENVMLGLGYNSSQFVNDYLTAQVLQGADSPVIQL